MLAAISAAGHVTIDPVAATRSSQPTWHMIALDCPAHCSSVAASDALFYVAGPGCKPSLHAYLVSALGADAILEHVLPLKASMEIHLAELSGSDLTILCARPALVRRSNLLAQTAATRQTEL